MKKTQLLCLLVTIMVIAFVGCGNQSGPTNPDDVQTEPPATENPEENLVPVEETYEYTSTDQIYSRPAMLTNERRVDFLSLAIDEGNFYCATAGTEKADEFVNAQIALLQFLRDNGMETAKLNYFAMDTDDSFSESDTKSAHIALSHTKSYQQVLITLQTLWGDYTDYGYLYAISNAIAAHLDWQTDTTEEAEQTTLDIFFSENPDALNLLYPCFTTTYASEETVRNCKALSKQLLETIDLHDAFTKSIDEQVNNFQALVDTYAQEISVTFARQESGYAYFGEYLPLKIQTTHVLHYIDKNYEDEFLAIQEQLGDDSWDYFSDYQSIFETIDIINEEITSSVAHFGLEDEAGIVAMNWLCAESAAELTVIIDGAYTNTYYNPTPDNDLFDGVIYITHIHSYLHEYFHHLHQFLNPELGHCWQAEAFAELGRARSKHGHHYFEWDFLHDEVMKSLFYNCFGRDYQSGLEDYYEAQDFLCHITNSFEFSRTSGSFAMNAFIHYLLDLYGEDTVCQILLFPETVETVTGKTWEGLQADWQQHMEKKFENFVIPDWLNG